MSAAPSLAARVLNLRRLRLITGLILFTYVGLHLLNHALGNVSIEAMEAGLALQKFVWQGILGTAALYLALTGHFGLGLWALFERRHYGWTGKEIVQLILGLSIPVLLANHIVATRVALTLYGLEKGYAQELYAFHVQSPFFGWVQVSVLLVAWLHGCLGVYFWLRLRRGFAAAAPWLAAAAVLVPVLALLGYFQGGRLLLAVAQDPAWRAANLTPDHVGTPDGNARLQLLRNGFLWIYGATLIAILAARGLRLAYENRGRKITVTYPDGVSVRVPAGFSVLEASLSAGRPHAHFCGGRGRCSTCRIEVMSSAGPLPRPSPAEQSVLERIDASPLTRLACQLCPLDDIAVAPLLPSDATAALHPLAPSGRSSNGEERFVAVLVVDIRDPTRLGAKRLPFDTVFIIDRIVEAIGNAIIGAGGRPSPFTGDGIVALFGTDATPQVACAQAVRAAVAIGRTMQALNAHLSDMLAGPIRFGIGIHGGSALVGEIGHGATRIYTAMGDTPSLASAFKALCRELDVEVVISDTIGKQSGINLSSLGRRIVEARGHDEPIAVRIAPDAEAIPVGA
jgi:adenylate cyclase